MAIMISDSDVKKYLSMEDCMEAMRVAFSDFAAGKANSPPRVRYISETPDPKRRYWCNVHVGAVPSYGMACVRAGSHVIGFDPQAKSGRARSYPDPINWTVVILYDLATAEPKGFMHESYLSGMRVAATSGAVVSAVAKEDAKTLGLFGTGRQARAHVTAICKARPSIETVFVYSPTRSHREALASHVDLPGVNIVSCDAPRSAVDGCDIICAATASSQPVFDGEWLVGGQLVISIANSDLNLNRYEVDDTVLKKAKTILINDWHSVDFNKQVELLDLIESGDISKDKVLEIGDVFSGKSKVRHKPDEIIYYKNNSGLGMQFAAAGAVIYERMKDLPNNREIPPEWLGAEAYSQGTG